MLVPPVTSRHVRYTTGHQSMSHTSTCDREYTSTLTSDRALSYQLSSCIFRRFHLFKVPPVGLLMAFCVSCCPPTQLLADVLEDRWSYWRLVARPIRPTVFSWPPCHHTSGKCWSIIMIPCRWSLTCPNQCCVASWRGCTRTSSQTLVIRSSPASSQQQGGMTSLHWRSRPRLASSLLVLTMTLLCLLTVKQERGCVRSQNQPSSHRRSAVDAPPTVHWTTGYTSGRPRTP